VNTLGDTQQGPANEGTKDLVMKDRGHVRLLMLNRPHRANALSPELMSALVEAFVDAGADPEVRAIVVTGAGDRAFSSGADLKARREADQAGKPFVYLMSARERFLFEVIYETYKPVIAAINGAAVAGGLPGVGNGGVDRHELADHVPFSPMGSGRESISLRTSFLVQTRQFIGSGAVTTTIFQHLI
jgi:hypothetical protein